MLGSGLGALLLGVEESAQEKPARQLRSMRVARDTRPLPVAASLLANNDRGEAGAAAPFSRREQQVLAQIASGATSAEIAQSLHISIHTVKNHRKSILRKAGCRNSGQLISHCAAHGLI